MLIELDPTTKPYTKIYVDILLARTWSHGYLYLAGRLRNVVSLPGNLGSVSKKERENEYKVNNQSYCYITFFSLPWALKKAVSCLR